MNELHKRDLDYVVACIAYLAAGHDRIGYRVWPPASGRTPEAPPKEYHDVRIHDCRPIAGERPDRRSGSKIANAARSGSPKR